MKVVATALVSIGLHLALGWEWTVLAGAIGGGWASRRGWLVGAGGTALGWAVLVTYTLGVAPASLRILVDTLGVLAGNIPGEALVGLTVLLGALLGALGGHVGALVRPLVDEHLTATG